MTGKAVGYQFLDALAKSIGMDAETVKQALAEINQLQTQTQALELAVKDKAPKNHASQQPVFGTADGQMYGHVKVAHEVTNDSTDGVAISPGAVYAYAPNRDTTPLGMVIYPGVDVIVNGIKAAGEGVFAQLNGNALSVSWCNSAYANLNEIDVSIPKAYKYKDINKITAYTNGGVAVSVSYTRSTNTATIENTGATFNACDSILVLLAPDNA